mgnify:CR=1 FL=1
MTPNEYRPLTTHTLSATTSSGATVTSAFNAQVNAVMVTATAGCFVAFGVGPTAATSSTYIPADYPLTFRVEGSDKAAAITGSGTATVYVTELSR